MKPMARRVYAFVLLALAVTLFFAVNIVSAAWLRTARLDLTAEGLYTVSQGTRATLAKLQEPVTLRFFFSRDAATGYAQVNAYAARVRDVLQEYALLADGKVILEEINPEPYTQEEDDAVALGLTGVPTQEGATVYFGLWGTNSLDGRETIPFFDQNRQEYLEYDLTSLVYRLSSPQKPKLGVLSALPLESGPGGVLAQLQGNARPLAVYTQLRETFDVQVLETSTAVIAPEIGTLLVAHPSGLDERTLYAIDQFVLRGGHAIVLVDPYSELAAEGGGGTGEDGALSSDMPVLLRAWGIAYDPTKVVADAARAQRVQVGAAQVVDYPVWLRLTGDNFNLEDPVTANVKQLNLATAGALTKVSGTAAGFAPLITSSDDAMLLDATLVRLTRNPQDLLRAFNATGERYVLAARISGAVKTAFAGGAPPATDDAPSEPLPVHLTETANANIIVVADSDLLDDRFWVQVQDFLGQRVAVPTADNGALIVNAVDNMMGSSDLISLRTRASADRPFTRVEALRREAESRFLTEEQQLQERVTQTEARLRELQGGATGGDLVLPEQQAEIENFRRELVETRASLRAVQANLRRDVEALGNRLALLNIAVVPVLVMVAAGILAVMRRRRSRRGVAA